MRQLGAQNITSGSIAAAAVGWTLVCLAQLTDLALKRLDPVAFVRRQARSLALVALGLANPTAKRLGIAAFLLAVDLIVAHSEACSV